jgi:hypothetical protein
MPSRPLRLTDQELDAVFAAARPLEPGLRDPFLQAVANALNGAGEIGPGTVARVCREMQRQFFNPPDFENRAVSRWSRKDGGIRRTVAAEG